jgi:hypothetical protein
MSGPEPEHYQSDDSESLKGTTLTVYRFLFRKGVPLRPHDVQSGLGLSSPSVAHYHLQKLLAAGLIQELPSGYVVNRKLFGDMMRIRTVAIPIQTTLVIFFSTAIVLMLTILRPPALFSSYSFALAVILVALGASISEVLRVLREP